MLRRGLSTICVFITLKANNPGTFLDTFKYLIEEIEPRRELESVPIHWCFPACALESRTDAESRLVPMLRGRVASGRDLLLPRGYSAAPHTLLLGEDIRRDLEWAVYNPWQSGIRDIFNGINPIVFPANPDWLRESIRDMYDSCESPLLLELANISSGRPCYLLKKQGEPIRRLAIYRHPANPRNRKRYRRDLLTYAKTAPDPVAIHIHTDDSTSPEQVAEQIESLRELLDTRLDFKNLTELESSGAVETSSLNSLPAISVPSTLCECFGYRRPEISASARGRRLQKESTNQSLSLTRQRLLASCSGVSGPSTDEPADQENMIVERSLIADMSGTVSLVNHDLTVFFEEGRLSEIKKRGDSVIRGGQAGSYYMVDNEKYEFTSDSAFSFEGEYVHGLRTALSIDGDNVLREGSLVRDYLFVEGEKSLVVSTVCAFPIFSDGTTVQAWSPFELPLFTYRHGAPLLIEVKTMDGEKYTFNLTGKTGTRTFAGNAFRITNGDRTIYVTYPESAINVCRQMPVIIEKRGARSTICISPDGCYLPVSGILYSRYISHTVFTIDVQAAEHDRFPTVKPHILTETGEPRCRYLNSETESSPL